MSCYVLLAVSVTQNRSHNRVSDTISQATLNTRNSARGVLIIHETIWNSRLWSSKGVRIGQFGQPTLWNIKNLTTWRTREPSYLTQPLLRQLPEGVFSTARVPIRTPTGKGTGRGSLDESTSTTETSESSSLPQEQQEQLLAQQAQQRKLAAIAEEEDKQRWEMMKYPNLHFPCAHSVLRVCLYYTQSFLECHQFDLCCSVLIVNHPCIVTNTKCNPSLFVIPFKNCVGIIDLQCCKNCHSLSGPSPKFQSSMTIFHCKNVRMQNIPNLLQKLAWIPSKFQSFVTVLVNLFIRGVIRTLATVA